MHSSNSCSHKNNNTAQYLSTTCKVKRKSINSPNKPTRSARRNGQLNNIIIGRGFASHKTTPTSTQHISRRNFGSGSSPSIVNTKCTNNTCSIPSYIDLKTQIDRINSFLDEIKIICSNNITTINLLKQGNKRLIK